MGLVKSTYRCTGQKRIIVVLRVVGLCIATPNSKVKNIIIILDESDFIVGNFRNI